MGSVFISYRRDDTDGQARALFQELVTRLGSDSVFMDVDGIALGRDFREALQERLASCDQMLTLIGKDWLDIKDKSGRRRLDNPGDFVRLEIAAALKRNIPVTPLLVHGAAMPTADQLPDELANLAFRNGFELSHSRWNSDVPELMKRLGLVARPDANAKSRTDVSTATPRQAGRPRFAIAAVSVAALIVAGVGLLYFKSEQDRRRAELVEQARLTATPPETRADGAGAQDPKGAVEAPKTRPQPGAPIVKPPPVDAPKAPPKADANGGTTNRPDSPALDKKTGSAGSADEHVRQERAHYFDSDFQLSISQPSSYNHRVFVVENVDLARDFVIRFDIKSVRNGGSTRYGIAWNYTREDFLLFTLHSVDGEGYSIGPGRSRQYVPFSRLAEGRRNINAEDGIDTLHLSKIGTALAFAINQTEVWRTVDYKLTSNQFAFWVADYSDALIKSYSVQQ